MLQNAHFKVPDPHGRADTCPGAGGGGAALPAVWSEEDVLQSMCGVVGSGDEAEEEEDEVGHPEDAGELLVEDLLPVRHLLLCVPPESVPADHLLQQKQKERAESCVKSYPFRSEGIHRHLHTVFKAVRRAIAPNGTDHCPSAGERAVGQPHTGHLLSNKATDCRGQHRHGPQEPCGVQAARPNDGQ